MPISAHGHHLNATRHSESCDAQRVDGVGFGSRKVLLCKTPSVQKGRFQRYEFEIRRPGPRHPAWDGKGFLCSQQQCRGGTQGVAGTIQIERWCGLATLDQPGPLQDNRSKRPKENSAHGCGFISMSSFSEAAGRQRANHYRFHASIARRCGADGSIGFFRERWLECTGLSLDRPFGLDERSTFTQMT
jgi:hypothetical protein